MSKLEYIIHAIISWFIISLVIAGFFAIWVFVTGCSEEPKRYRFTDSSGQKIDAYCTGAYGQNCGYFLDGCTNGKRYRCVQNIELE